MYQNQFEKALIYFLDGLELLALDEDSYSYLPFSYERAGRAYLGLNQYKLAEEYFKNGLEKAEAIEDNNTKADCLDGLGRIFLKEGKSELGLMYLEQSLNINLSLNKLKDLIFESRGEVDIKGKGSMEMFLVKKETLSLTFSYTSHLFAVHT